MICLQVKCTYNGVSGRTDLLEASGNTLTVSKGKKVKADIALHGNPISELRDVTCHMGSHSVTSTYLPPDTSERAPPIPQPCRLVLDLLTPKGWKAELI